jgi:hypothetical protein
MKEAHPWFIVWSEQMNQMLSPVSFALMPTAETAES